MKTRQFYMHFYVYRQSHSFIHWEELYSAASMILLRNVLVKHPRSGLPPTVLYNLSYLQLQLQLQSVPDPNAVEKSSLEVNIKESQSEPWRTSAVPKIAHSRVMTWLNLGMRPDIQIDVRLIYNACRHSNQSTGRPT